jgi:hypothetical protein
MPTGLLVTFAALVFSSKLNEPLVNWYLNINNYNRNMIASLKRLNELSTIHDFKSSKGVLVAGVRGPYHPYRHQAYILHQTPLPENYSLLLRKSETTWNDSSIHMGNSLYSDQLNISSFDFFIVYARDGSITRILSLDEMRATPDWQQMSVLACELDPKIITWSTSLLEDIVACLDQADENVAIIELVKHLKTVELSPILHYYLGHAYQSVGDFFSARVEYELALTAGENKFFRNALDSLPNK